MIGIYGTVYNSADTIKLTIDSLLRTIKEEFIIVVTDNFSTDETYEELKKYEFIDVIRTKCTRGTGRQISLEYLIKNYKPEYIFYIDFDLIFVPFFYNVLKQIKRIYQEGEIYFPFGFASYETYLSILNKNIKWPNMLVMEDHLWTRDLIRNNFNVKFLCIPLALNQVRKKRERKYSTNTIGYILRKIRIHIDYLYYLIDNLIRIHHLKTEKWQFEKSDFVLPEDLNLDRKLFFFAEKTIPEKLKQRLHGEQIYVYKGNKFIYLFRDFDVLEFVKNKVLVVEGYFNEKEIKQWRL